eukprot:Seg3979.2 transcript_id=Seg3979.2/GoldUCD/mRNA.D3Y31 product="hypothetical protein" protein_id=Seg3979.2/GoldUCD/D3Y31
MLLFLGLQILLFAYEIRGNSVEEESDRELLTRRDETFDFATRICGVSKRLARRNQEKLNRISKARALGLCDSNIIKQGCYEYDDNSEFARKRVVLIDQSKNNKARNYKKSLDE